MNLAKTFLGLSIGIVFFSCKSSVSPDEKNPRDYSWTKTAIGNGGSQVIPSDLWGSSPTDVYVVGHCSTPFENKILHFNGSQWTDLSTKYIEAYADAHPGVQVFNWKPSGVWGFGSNDVWIVGSRDTSAVSQGLKQGFVVRFNGTVWREVPIAADNLYGIWGASPSDLWACGIGGRFYHFNGSAWTDYWSGDSILVNYFAGTSNSLLYAFGQHLSSGIIYSSLLEWNGSSWRVAEVAPQTTPQVFRAVNVIGGNLYTSTSDAVKKRISEGSWNPIFQDPDPSWAFNRAKGLSESNIFVVGGPGEIIFHFDGSDWKRLTQFFDPTIFYNDLIVFESAVFAIGRNTASSNGFILQGK